MTIKELRKSKGITQLEAANLLSMSRRGYQELEYANKEDSRSYKDAFIKLSNYNKIEEDKGILSINEIITISNDVFLKYDVQFAYLFGSYSRNEAREDSDIDILVSTKLTGLKFFGLVEDLREKLHKRVDLVSLDNVEESFELLKDVLKDGIKIYKKN